MHPSDADLTGISQETAPRRVVAHFDADGGLTLDGLPSREERERIAATATVPEPLLADLRDAELEAQAAEQAAVDAIEAGADEDAIAAHLARHILRADHAHDLRHARRLSTRAQARPLRCGARARTPRPAAARTRGSRRAVASRSGPDDDAGGEPEPPSRRHLDLSGARRRP